MSLLALVLSALAWRAASSSGQITFAHALLLAPPISNDNFRAPLPPRRRPPPRPSRARRKGGRRRSAPLRAVPGEAIAASLASFPTAVPPEFASSAPAAASAAPLRAFAAPAASAALTYLGLLLAYDRPRGSLAPGLGLEVRPSAVAGLGLFATRALSVGTVLGTYPGVLRPAEAFYSGKCQQFPAAVGYSWRFTDSRYVLDPTDGRGEMQDACCGGTRGVPLSDAAFRTLLRFLAVDTALCRINEPPIGAGGCNVGARENLASREVVFTLVRDVSAGQELFLDYGLDYDRSSYGRNPAVDAAVGGEDDGR